MAGVEVEDAVGGGALLGGACIHQNHILRLLVCTRKVRVNYAQKCMCLRLLCSCLLCIFFRDGQANPIQTS